MTNVDVLDPYASAIYLEVPSDKIVLLQGYFELFEGVGIVRTLSVKRSLVCIMATPDTIQDCMRVLEEIRGEIPWKVVDRPQEAIDQLYLGYFGNKATGGTGSKE